MTTQTTPSRARRALRCLTLVAAATATTAAVAGCGPAVPKSITNAANAANKPTTAPNACDLFTQTIAETTLGKPVKKDHDTRLNPHETQCGYSGPKAFADVIVGDCDFMTSFNIESGATPVPGVGDSAEASATGLQSCKGDVGVDISVGITGSFSGSAADNVEAHQEQLEKQLAIAVLGQA